MKSKTVLVTGGAGCVGSHVVDMLIGRGDKVVVVDDFNDFYSPAQKRSNVLAHVNQDLFTLIEADLRTKGLFEELFEKNSIDLVVHMAARAGVGDSLIQPKLYFDVNVMGSLNLLEAMRKSGVSKLVYASSSSVYGNKHKGPFSENDATDVQISPYGASKKSLELVAATYNHLYGLNVVGLRFFTAYGPRNRPDMACFKFVDAIEKGKVLTKYGDGGTSRDYTFVGDIARGVIKAIDANIDCEIINLGNSTPVKLLELVLAIEKACGKKARIKELPVPAGDVLHTWADISKAKRLLGWQPETSLEDGLGELVEWYRGKTMN